MSRLIRRAALLAAVASNALGAQASAEARAQARVVDTLVAMWKRAMRDVRAYDDSVFVRVAPDTLRVGHLTVLVDRAIRARVEPIVRGAAAEIDRLAGDNAAGLAGRLLTVRRLRETTTDTIVVSARGRSGNEVLEQWGAAPDYVIAQWLMNDAIWLLSDNLDKSFASWLSMELRPDSESTVSMSQQRLDLVSGDHTIGKRCYAGDLGSCKSVLGLMESADPWREWYDSAGRHRIVSELQRRHQLPRSLWAAANKCVDGNDAECLDLLRRRGFQPSISPSPRQSLTRLAILMGGAGSYGRILGAKGSPAERLAVAAGVPIDDVVKEWQQRVVTTRAPQADMTPGIAIASFGWVLLCGALSLRSSRWR